MTVTSLTDELPGLIVQYAELIFPQSFWNDVGSNIQPAGERGLDLVLWALHTDALMTDFPIDGTSVFLELSQTLILEEFVARFAAFGTTSVHKHYRFAAT